MHFKEKLSFLPLTSSHKTFPLPTPPLSLPAAAIDCIIDANTVTCVRSGTSSSLLLCNTLLENIKCRKQSHARRENPLLQWPHSRSRCFGIVSSRWLRTKKYCNKFQLMIRSPCHIHNLVLLPTLLSLVISMHHDLILKYFFRFPPICAASFQHQPQQTIRLAEHTFPCVTWTWHYR